MIRDISYSLNRDIEDFDENRILILEDSELSSYVVCIIIWGRHLEVYSGGWFKGKGDCGDEGVDALVRE